METGVFVCRFSKLDTFLQFLASYSHLGFGWDRAQQKGPRWGSPENGRFLFKGWDEGGGHMPL